MYVCGFRWDCKHENNNGIGFVHAIWVSVKSLFAVWAAAVRLSSAQQWKGRQQWGGMINVGQITNPPRTFRANVSLGCMQFQNALPHYSALHVELRQHCITVLAMQGLIWMFIVLWINLMTWPSKLCRIMPITGCCWINEGNP